MFSIKHVGRDTVSQYTKRILDAAYTTVASENQTSSKKKNRYLKAPKDNN